MFDTCLKRAGYLGHIVKPASFSLWQWLSEVMTPLDIVPSGTEPVQNQYKYRSSILFKEIKSWIWRMSRLASELNKKSVEPVKIFKLHILHFQPLTTKMLEGSFIFYF